MKNYITPALHSTILATALTFSGPAFAQAASSPMVANVVSSTYTQDGISAQFEPRPTGVNTRLDYEVLDLALDGTVIRLGTSLRRFMGKPPADLGSRIVSGHKSGYRLEGSRVAFSFFSEDYIEELTAYRQDLERIGSQINLTAMNKNEQLAFWFNLHNVIVIEQISRQYPTKRPHKLKIDGTSIDEVKYVTIKGVPLSTKDIREKIVYTHWKNPSVIYGFFRGDIGSPALQNFAYTRDNVGDVLKIQAQEYVNALRGFHSNASYRKISKLYKDAEPYFFPNFETDITQHLLTHAREDVAVDIKKPLPYRVDNYDYVIADLLGGSAPRSVFNVQSIGSDGVQRSRSLDAMRYPPELQRLIRELDRKTQALRQRKWIGTGGTVTIEDIETVDPDAIEIQPQYDPNVDPDSEYYVPPTSE